MREVRTEALGGLRTTLVPIAALACFALLPAVRSTPRLLWSILGASAALLAFYAVLSRRAAAAGRTPYLEFVPKPVHYVQLLMHSSVYAYWGWYWHEVYRQVPLILAQVAFLYALDMLVCWSRRDRWILGFGGFPIVLSTNLFLWFKPDWYFLQFLMIATGVLCKEFVTWERDGRRTHIFNPSAIALFLFSIGLIATGTTSHTWASEIAVSFNNPPFIYLEIFALGLVVQSLFSVTLVTLAGTAALFGLTFAYTRWTGLYYFVDTGLPAAVFLGLHLLITDPATSPKESPAKALFGAAYGAGVFALYWILDPLGLSFYDKLLCVPLLNLTVRALDRASRSLTEGKPLSDWLRSNRVHMAAWIGFFLLMVGAGVFAYPFPGSDPRFWRAKCAQGGGTACARWVEIMDSACQFKSASGCVDLGNALADGGLIRRDPVRAGKAFAHVCELGSAEGCGGLLRVVRSDGGVSLQGACDGGDGESCFLLGSLAVQGQGVPADPARGAALFGRACGAGWPRGCFGLADLHRRGVGVEASDAKALEYYGKACAAGIAPSCFAGAALDHDRRDDAAARESLRSGCALVRRYASFSQAYAVGDALSAPSAEPPACAAL